MNIQDIVAYWKILKRRWWLPTLLVIVTCSTIVVLSLLANPVYVATARFQVTAPPPGDINIFQAFGRSSLRDEIFYTRENFISVLSSLDVAWNVVDTLGLNMNGRELKEMVTVEPVEGSDFTEISVSTDDPELSAKIANALMSEGMKKYGEIIGRGTTNGREFVNEQLSQIGLELNEAQQNLISFKIENRIGDLDSVISAQQTLIRSLNLARDEALANGNAQIAANYDKLISERTLELQDQVQLSTDYTALLSKVDQLSQTYNLLVEKQIESQLKEDAILNLGFIQPLGESRVPREPEAAIQLNILVLGAILALVLGVVIAFVWEYIQQNTKIPQVDMPSANREEDMVAV